MFRLRVTERSFRRRELDAAIYKAERNALTKAGAFVRLTARRSLKPAAKLAGRVALTYAWRYAEKRIDRAISRPGEPPRIHTKDSRGLKLIRFAWIHRERIVIVGQCCLRLWAVPASRRRWSTEADRSSSDGSVARSQSAFANDRLWSQR